MNYQQEQLKKAKSNQLSASQSLNNVDDIIFLLDKFIPQEDRHALCGKATAAKYAVKQLRNELSRVLNSEITK